MVGQGWGCGDVCFSNMGSGSPGSSQQTLVLGSMAQFRSGPNPGLPWPSPPSSQAPGVLLWLPGRKWAERGTECAGEGVD